MEPQLSLEIENLTIQNLANKIRNLGSLIELGSLISNSHESEFRSNSLPKLQKKIESLIDDL